MKIILECLNEPSFSKCLDLDSRITIGRQIAPKTLAEPTNGIFDAKVLSRFHAEIFSQDAIPYIRDLNSSNGTFINEISIADPSGKVGEPHQLKHLDVVVFGMDIPDDNGNDLFKKVVCKVIMVDQMDNVGMDATPNTQTDNTNDKDFAKLSQNEKLGRISSLISQELMEIKESKDLIQEYVQGSVNTILEISQNQQELKEISQNQQALKEFVQKEISGIKKKHSEVEKMLELQKVLKETTAQNTIEISKLKNQIKWTYQNLLIITISLGGLLLFKKYSKL